MTDAKSVVLTGGSRGLGLALTDALLNDGYRVVTCSRNRSAAVDELLARAGPDHFSWYPCVLGDEESERAFMKSVRSWAETPWALVNNAGVAIEGLLAMTPPGHIEAVLQSNVLGTLRLTRLAVKLMLPAGRGRIVNISSIVGLRGYAGLAAYSATKGALDGFTRALARELGPRGITVNSVAPGYLDTEMASTLAPGQLHQIVRRTPLGRLGTALDVVPLVRLLLSEDSAFVTGQTLVVDGGLTA